MPEDWTKIMKHGVRTAMIKNRIYRWSFLRNRRWVAGVHQASVCIFFRSRTVERNPKLSSQNNSYLCYYWKELIFFQTKLKGGTYQMKALDLDWADSNGTVCVTTEETSFSRKRNLKYVSTQMKALNEYIQESHILMVLFVLLLERVHFLVKRNLNMWALKCKQSRWVHSNGRTVCVIAKESSFSFKRNSIQRWNLSNESSRWIVRLIWC